MSLKEHVSELRRLASTGRTGGPNINAMNKLGSFSVPVFGPRGLETSLVFANE